MIQILISLTESAYKEMCENGTDNVDYDIRQMMREGIVISRNLCDSCKTKGCIFQYGIVRNHCDFYKAKSIGELPPVNLTKTGRWILIDKELSRYKCSECGEVIKLYKKSEVSKLEKDETLSDYPFSHCGAKMVEPRESEG